MFVSFYYLCLCKFLCMTPTILELFLLKYCIILNFNVLSVSGSISRTRSVNRLTNKNTLLIVLEENPTLQVPLLI